MINNIEQIKHVSNIQFTKQEIDEFFKSNKAISINNEYVPLNTVALIAGVDPSVMRRSIKKLGYKFEKKVISESGQLANVVSKDTAMQILKDREEKGYVINFLHREEK
jgi:hypothetical protein